MTNESLKGAETERRFFSVMSARSALTPLWLVRVRRAPAALDVRGIDAVAYILPKGDTEPARVPLQIKSSETGRHHYLNTKSQLHLENVLIVVVTDSMTDEDIRNTVYELLRPIRKSRKRFGDFYRLLMKDDFDAARLQKLKSLVNERRTKADSK